MELAFGFSTYYIGVLVAAGFLINVIFQPLTGRATQHFEPSVLLSLGISIMAVSMVLFAISSTFLMMMLSVVIMRLGSSFFHPVGAVAISRTYAGKQLDSSMGIESAFGNLGIVFSFMLSAPLYLKFGWSGPFIIFAILESLAVIFTLITSTGMPRINGNESLVGQPMVTRERSTSGDRRYFLYIPAFFVITAFIMGASNTIFGNFGNLLLFHSGFSISLSNDLIALWVTCAFFGAIITGGLTRLMSRMKLLSISFLVSGVTCLGFAFLSGSFLLSVGFLAMNGLFLGIVYPATYSELGELFSGQGTSGSSFGILFSSQIVGSSLFGFLGGYFSSTLGLPAIFELTAILLISSVIVVFVWNTRYRPSFLTASKSY